MTITDPVGSPTFSSQSWKLETDTSTKLHRLNETRQPFDHNVTSSTVDEFLNPSHNGSFTNDTSTLKSSSGATRVFEYNASGDPTGELVKQGSSGTAYYVAATDYLGGTNENRKHLVTARYVYPQAETSRTAASRIATTFDHTFWTDTDTVQTRTTTLPAVASGENGSDSSTTLVEYYDNRGRLRWRKDGAGAVSYFSYHPEHGHLAYAVRDADPSSLPASADNNESKWVEPDDGVPSSNQPSRGSLPTAVEQVTRHEFDSQGRVVLTATEDGTDGTILARHYTVYEAHRLLQFPYWDTSTNRPLLPIEVTVYDNGGTVTDQYTVDPARTAQSGGVPTGLADGTNQSHYLRWSRSLYDEVSSELTATHVYHDIPASGYGTKDTQLRRDALRVR